MVCIESPCRLHLGQLDLNGSLGRMYGGIGVALSQPRIVMKAEASDQLIVEGHDAERVKSIAGSLLNKAQIQGGARITVEESIPAHIGLGSGTQLSLAVGVVLARLYKLDLTFEDIVSMLLPNVKLDVCIGIFKDGGLVVASGIPTEGKLVDSPGYTPPIVFQHPIPPDWHFVLVSPETATEFGGNRPVIPIDPLPPVPPEDVGLICRLLVMQLLPAVIEGNIDEFGQALTEIQWTIGKQFAPIQGGPYSHPAAEGIVRILLNSGATGAGQSSWGPTVYAVAEGAELATQLEAGLHKHLEKLGISASVRCTTARNCGAILHSEEGV